ncbi:hypothetical protein B0I37DRAFT_363108 [Chaetomium sp. MPI-CAGE-AT-0009]|nr:hypothetical protein B0I37DRAFT_363108 [Chaetomium sp. MPI-CAGE-AT-0009]
MKISVLSLLFLHSLHFFWTGQLVCNFGVFGASFSLGAIQFCFAYIHISPSTMKRLFPALLSSSLLCLGSGIENDNSVMRTTGPTVRRQNHVWLQMRRRERRAGKLARRQQEDDTDNDGDVSDNDSDGDSVSSLDSVDSVDSLDSDDEANPQPTPVLGPVIAGAKVGPSLGASLEVRPAVAASVSARARTGRWIKNLPRAEVAAGVTLGVGEVGEGAEGAEGVVEDLEPESESETDGIDSDGIDSDGEESGEESAEESTAPPALTTPPPAGVAPPPPGITSAVQTSSINPPPPPAGISSSTATPKRDTNSPDSTGIPPQLAPIVAPSGSSSSNFDDLVTSLTRDSSQTILTSATSSVAATVPVTEATQSEEAQIEPPNSQPNELGREGLGIGGAPNKLNSGAVAGIVLGVLAVVGLLAAAALLWRKRRRDRGLPFFPQTRLRLRDDDDGAYPGSVTGPLPGRVGGQNAAKTNTQIMDDLMKAAYAANNGGNDMESAYAPPPKQQTANLFMDEKAYMTLAGPPTPAPAPPPIPPSPTPTAQKPVMRWLDEVRTPTQPNGPEIPPTPLMPPSATMPSAGGRAVDPPKPAYYGRDTMTTDTTATSVRWYG